MKRLTRSGRPALVALLLGLHLLTRLHANVAIPLEKRHFYPTSYLVSLSLVSGNGFNYLLPPRVDPELPLSVVVGSARTDAGPSGRVMDFISTGRPSLSRQELADYVSSGAQAVPVSNAGPGSGGSGLLAASRVLDIYVTAALWKVFGISWSVFFVFYAIVSTMANLLVFLIVRRLSGSFWCGVIGAAGFLASPLENYAGAWSIRDTSPLWFAALGFFLLLRFWRPTGSPLATCSQWIALGFASLLGLGWRTDVQLLSLFTLVSLVSLLALHGYAARRIALSVACFVVGCVAVTLLISWLGPVQYREAGDALLTGRGDGYARTEFVTGTFHVAWYGEQSRSELLSTENTFQVVRDDYLTLLQADYFGRQRRDDTSTHFQRCRNMYLEMAAYDAHAWWLRFPHFLMLALQVDRPVLPGANLIGGDAGQAWDFMARRPEWLRPIHRWVLDPYRSSVPYLFVIGLGTSLLRGRGRLLALPLAMYFFCYAAVLLLILPESKHWAQLLLPLHVFAALGLWDLASGSAMWLSASKSGPLPKRRILSAALAAGLLALAWGLIGVATYAISRAQRKRLVDSVLSRLPSGPESWQSLDQTKLFTVRTQAGTAASPIGYLLKVRGGRRPLDLFCIHVREPGGGRGALVYWTRHIVEPDREQFLFANIVSGTRVRDERPYTLFVRVTGGARLLASAKIDLSEWRIGLPLSFVFGNDDRQAGSPFVGDDQPATQTSTLEAVRAMLP